MSTLWRRRGAAILGLSVLALGSACGRNDTSSKVLVSDVAHSPVKRQSIGNCWLYAAATWAESLHLAATGEVANLSESYWTYWFFYDQIVDSSIDEVATGGYWSTATSLINRVGYIDEGDFIQEEDSVEMSMRQKRAVDAINAALAEGGELGNSGSRTHEATIHVLDQAFGVNMREAQQSAHRANELVVGYADQGQPIMLDQYLTSRSSLGWQWVSYPQIYGTGQASAAVIAQRQALLRRVMRAVNDRWPVVLSLMIDFNALDIADATFKGETLVSAGAPGTQGGHLLVLEDYVVDDVPGIGTIGEGDVSESLKELALDGRVRHFKAKNSWGTNRPERGLTDGYTRFRMDYLDGQFPWRMGEGSSSYSTYTTTMGFALPVGY